MDKQNIIKNNFSKYSKYYDSYAQIQKIVANDLIKLIPKLNYSDILELGCGTGLFTELIVNKFPHSNITAIDNSDIMIQTSKNKNTLKNVNFIEMDLNSNNLLFGDTFKLITSNASLHWVLNLKLLKLSARMYFSAFGPKTYFELQDVLNEYFKNEINITSKKFPDLIQWNNLLNKASIEEKNYCLEFNSFKDLLLSIKYTGTRGNVQIKRNWTKNDLLQLERIYISKYKKIISTYQVFFIACDSSKIT